MSPGPALVVLAGGMGSRFGGLKQIAPVGPHGEVLLEYSIFDAARAGFGKAVVVIASAFESEFRERVLPRLSTFIDVDYVLQDRCATGRRPDGLFGTGHAVLAAAPKVTGRFAVINADDYYGRAAYEEARAAFAVNGSSETGCSFLIGYPLGRTLSPSGPVSRAIIERDGTRLSGLVEHTHILRNGDVAESRVGDHRTVSFPLDAPASMNFWGFSPDVPEGLGPLFDEYLGSREHDSDREFRLPEAVLALVKAGAANVEVRTTSGDWFGMTHPQDHERACRTIKRLVEAGEYPPRLGDVAVVE